jgi:hypothetical protein
MDIEEHERARPRTRRPLPERTSAVLYEIAYSDGERVTFNEILQQLRHRAFGFMMMIFAVPCMLPMPPGIPTISGIALVIIAVNLILVRRRLWLPRKIAEKSLARSDLRRIVERVSRPLQRLERICRPRLAVVTEPVGKVLVGVVVLALGILMILPIPFIGNIPPGIAASVIAIGLTERDGVVVLVGLVVGTIALGVAGAASWAAMLGLLELLSGS